MKGSARSAPPQVVGVDYGARRTGVAGCDGMGILASPVGVLEFSDPARLCVELIRIAEERGADGYILGLPLRTDGTKGDKALVVEAFAERLREASGRLVTLWDERFTTVQAHRMLREAGLRAKKQKPVIDAMAAVLILQSYLDAQKNS